MFVYRLALSDLHEYREPDIRTRTERYGARRRIPKGKPKNIEVLSRLSQPLDRLQRRKFTPVVETREFVVSTDLTEPKNMEELLRLSKPLDRYIRKPFAPPPPKRYPLYGKVLKEPKNMEEILRLSAPNPRFIRKPFQPPPERIFNAHSLPPPRNLDYLASLSAGESRGSKTHR